MRLRNSSQKPKQEVKKKPGSRNLKPLPRENEKRQMPQQLKSLDWKKKLLNMRDKD